MKQQKNLREEYIQLVEAFITAIESGKSGSELEEIRGQIRNISARLGLDHSVDNPTQRTDFVSPNRQRNEDIVE